MYNGSFEGRGRFTKKIIVFVFKEEQSSNTI